MVGRCGQSWRKGQMGLALIRAILLAVPLAVVLLLVGACPSAGGQGSSRSTGGAEKKDIPERTGVGESGYIEKLEKVYSNKASQKDVTMSVSVIPDAYAYHLAVGIADLERKGYTGKELYSKARSLYNDVRRKHRGKVLLRVKISASGGANYFFISQRVLRRHFDLKQKTSKSFSALNPRPIPKLETWKVFDGTGRGFNRMNLCALNQLEVDIYSMSLKVEETEPIHVVLKGVTVQSQSADPNESINVRERQVATKRWEENTIQELPVELLPAKWEVPEMPKPFRAYLDRLEGK